MHTQQQQNWGLLGATSCLWDHTRVWVQCHEGADRCVILCYVSTQIGFFKQLGSSGETQDISRGELSELSGGL